MSLGCPAELLALIVLRLDNLEWQQRETEVQSVLFVKLAQDGQDCDLRGRERVMLFECHN